MKFSTFSLLLMGVCLVTNLFGQAPVPTAWNCDTISAIPQGWTLNVDGADPVYTSSQTVCQGSQSLKMKATNHSLTIHLASLPGTVIYQIGGTGNGTWNGTYVVQESTDGNTWSTMKSYTTGMLNNSQTCLLDSVTPANPATRYIRFFYQQKVTNYNLRLDDIKIKVPVLPVQKIAVRQNNTPLVNGGYAIPFNSQVGTPVTETFELRNIGTVNTLNIDSVVISGTHASEFSVVSPGLPVPVTALTAVNLNIGFTPQANGTRTATMTIYSDDLSSDSIFTVELYGVGGNLASEPTAQASALSFPALKTWRADGTFAQASPQPDFYGGYLILRSEGAPVSGVPTDGTNYQKGETIGNAKVIFKGKGTGNNPVFLSNGLVANTTYHYAIYTFNGGGSNFVNYLATSPATGNTVTPPTMVSPSEYNAINTSNTSFVTDLSSLVNPHTPIFYSNYRNTMINGFDIRDTFAVVGNNTFSRYMTCSYSRQKVLFNDPFDFTALDMSREHSFPHSWMPTNPADNPERPEYNDQHNLYPTLQSNVNSTRCNYPFGEVVNVISSFGGAKFGTDAAGNRVYEPADEHKGRAARALMYMTIAYNGIAGNAWNFDAAIGENCNQVYVIPAGQDQNLMKTWHFLYGPDRYDIARNDYLDSLQGNRNPFVDQPEFACYIDFSNMTYIANPSDPCFMLSSKNEQQAVHFNVFPNPSQGMFNLNIWGDANGQAVISMIDMTGKTILSYEKTLTTGNNTFAFSEQLAPGVYIIKVSTASGSGVLRYISQ